MEPTTVRSMSEGERGEGSGLVGRSATAVVRVAAGFALIVMFSIAFLFFRVMLDWASAASLFGAAAVIGAWLLWVYSPWNTVEDSAERSRAGKIYDFFDIFDDR